MLPNVQTWCILRIREWVHMIVLMLKELYDPRDTRKHNYAIGNALVIKEGHHEFEVLSAIAINKFPIIVHSANLICKRQRVVLVLPKPTVAMEVLAKTSTLLVCGEKKIHFLHKAVPDESSQTCANIAMFLVNKSDKELN